MAAAPPISSHVRSSVPRGHPRTHAILGTHGLGTYLQLQSAECQAPPLEALDNRACRKRRVRSSTRLKHSEVTACREGVKRARVVIVPIRFLWMPSGLMMIHVLSDAVPFLHIQCNATNDGREAAHPDGSWTLPPPHGMPRLTRPG